MDWSQLTNLITEVAGDFRNHKWLLAFALLFAYVFGLWKGTMHFPYAPVDAWIKNEQKKIYSTYFQYINFGLLAISTLLADLAGGIKPSIAIITALVTFFGGLIFHDAGGVAAMAKILKSTKRGGSGPAVVICLLAAFTVSGCASWWSACATALPAIQFIQSEAQESYMVLNDEKQFISQLPIPADALAKINADLGKAEDYIKLLNDAAATAATACSKPDVSTIIADLAAVWADLEPLIVPFLKPGMKGYVPKAVIRYRAQVKK